LGFALCLVHLVNSDASFFLTGWTAFLQWLQAEMDACPWGSDIKDLVEGGLACPANISFPMSTTIYYAELVDKQ